MRTNQSANPGDPRVPELRCRHAKGAARPETCAYLRALERLRQWIDRAEQAHVRGDDTPLQIEELWLLMAEISTAFDLCPDAQPTSMSPEMAAKSACAG
jgi:hypothetical protein